MSILIKDMDMPTACNKCPIRNINSHDVWYETCPVTKFSPRQVPYNGKPNWCPLTEVSTPHGRLIDADGLLKIAYDYIDDFGLEGLANALERMPTIVEAEE